MTEVSFPGSTRLHRFNHTRLPTEGKEDTEGHKIDELYEFSNDSTMIKCFERSTVERVEENSNDVSRCLFICTHNTLNIAMAK